MNNKVLTGAGLITGVVLLLAVNMLSSVTFTSARLDLTERKAYTLSQGTKNILAKLDEPITLRLFLSEGIASRTASVASYANRVRDMLDELKRRSNGMVKVKIIDPEPFSEAEDRAVGFGLHGIPLDSEGANFYFGLVGSNSADDEVVVPYLSMEREEFLEYDLAKVMWQLSDIDTKVAGLITTLPINGIDPQQAMRMGGQAPPPWVVMEQVSQLFEIRPIAGNAVSIPSDVDVLMVVHPKGLSEATLYAIDQFVMGGGRALLFLDPFSEADRPDPRQQQGIPSRSSSLGKLPKAWGFEVDGTKFVGDLQHAIKVRFEHKGQMIAMEYPAWVDLPQERMAAKDTVTAELGKLVFGTAGEVRSTGAENVVFTPLVTTSDQAMLMGIATMMNPARDPQALVRDYKPGGKELTIAARIGGKLKSAFPDGAPKSALADGEDATKKPAHISETTTDANLIVIADTDFMEDRFWVQTQNVLGTRLAVPNAGNGSFVVNALDSLTGSNDLISVRSRGRFSRPFTRVEDIRREAELKFREKEQQLTEELNQAEAKLTELSRGNPGGNAPGMVLGPEQQAEIERFRTQKLRIRGELREVLHQRRKNIEDLEFNLRMLNIGLMPLFIIIAGMLVAVWQSQRRRRSQVVPT
jgi:ABC-type uncharacterized transport system involved in gliding motility auxiliary subunit